MNFKLLTPLPFLLRYPPNPPIPDYYREMGKCDILPVCKSKFAIFTTSYGSGYVCLIRPLNPCRSQRRKHSAPNDILNYFVCSHRRLTDTTRVTSRPGYPAIPLTKVMLGSQIKWRRRWRVFAFLTLRGFNCLFSAISEW